MDRGHDGDDLVRVMVAYQAGELNGFERLYAACVPELRRYLQASLRDHGVVQDLIQETFMEIHRARRSYRPPLPVRPWVFGVARNVLRRHRRTSWRRSRHEDAWIEGASERATGVSGARPAVGRDDVEEAIRRLPEGRRAVWVLHHRHGLSFQEIGERLRIGVGAAKLRSSRAMKALRSALGIESGARDE